ncbi:unnamed protein product, partial [Meganyctiphanes norvegica]
MFSKAIDIVIEQIPRFDEIQIHSYLSNTMSWGTELGDTHSVQQFLQIEMNEEIDIKVKEEFEVHEKVVLSQYDEVSVNDEMGMSEKPIRNNDAELPIKSAGEIYNGPMFVPVQHTVNKPFECYICAKAFSRKDTLIGHWRTHTGDKPYQCKQCDMAFSLNTNLIDHLRIHTGEKPYQCNQCDKAFTQKSNLIRHQRAHTGEKPH